MSSPPLLSVQGLHKSYRSPKRPFHAPAVLPALIDITLQLASHSTLVLVGRSGSGKSTLARCIARLEAADSGAVFFAGRNLMHLHPRELKPIRRELQIVFQHSATAINPLFTALEAVAEPLDVQQIGHRRERRERALEAIETVGLPRAWAHRSSLEFSGGERQRLALARALILEPRLLILDEALSGLDRVTQNRISDLLHALQQQRSLAYLFITHDLQLASRVGRELAVMEHGRIVESGPVAAILAQPQSDAAAALVRAIPQLPGTSPSLTA
ncbi:MAG TPA: dipeptide/oligopeptide/nickel ABC transporter ATP-binding protein [Bryobacteraceae bacterium]|jgi:peptide/nickel transport system ATP-binding protein|nr:dipeptide/oligopeptide/nickel ABC transporter ATP-binding protein [Bryobacteraceae bacterium]